MIEMPLSITTLEESFDLVAPRGAELVATFYRRLFTLDPELQALFAGTDMETQRGMLLSALVLVRRSLRDPERLVPTLVALGTRHERYGVRPAHFAPVGRALLEALAEVAGPAWTEEYTAAWLAAYGVIRDTMLSGYQRPVPSVPEDGRAAA
jgi:hemoglobin-like flavoprotein